MPTAIRLPRCLSRLAKPNRYQPWSLLLVGTLWLTTATKPLSAEQSVLRLVGPADRTQLQSTDEACTLIPVETPIESPEQVQAPAPTTQPTARVVPVEYADEALANPFQRMANRWLARIGSQPLAIANTSASQFSTSYNSQSEPAAQLVSASEQADEDALRCYTSKPMSMMQTSIAVPQGRLPDDAAALCSETVPTIGDRRQDCGWAMTDHNWSATGMHHRPLYFEEENLERHGYTPSCRFQPVISGARFFFTIPILPYKMMIDRPRSCVYTLGYYRPGSCAPRRWHHLPLKVGASAVEIGVIVGLIALFP